MLQLGEKFFSGQLALCDGIAGFCAIFNEASYLHEVGAGVGFYGRNHQRTLQRSAVDIALGFFLFSRRLDEDC